MPNPKPRFRVVGFDGESPLRAALLVECWEKQPQRDDQAAEPPRLTAILSGREWSAGVEGEWRLVRDGEIGGLHYTAGSLASGIEDSQIDAAAWLWRREHSTGSASTIPPLSREAVAQIDDALEFVRASRMANRGGEPGIGVAEAWLADWQRLHGPTRQGDDSGST